MTDCYYVLLASISSNDAIIVRMFLYALAVVIAHPVLGWTPAWMRAQSIYLAICMAGFFAWIIVFGLFGMPPPDLPSCAF